LAIFFIPPEHVKENPKKNIEEDVLYDLNRLLPPEAIVCVGIDAYDNHRENYRDIDLVIITNTAVHVVESKDKKGEPVIYNNKEGLFIQHENGSITRIMNGDEPARTQAIECADCVKWGFYRASKEINTSFAYILVPYAYEGSDLTELTGPVRGSKSVIELVELINKRDSNPKYNRGLNGLTISDIEYVLRVQFNAHQTDTIKGYKIGNTPRPVDRTSKFNRHGIPTNNRSVKKESRTSNNQETIQYIGALVGKAKQLVFSISSFIKKNKYYCATIVLVLFLMFFLLHGLTLQRGCFNGTVPLNMRSAPTSQSEKVGQIDKGSCFYVNGISQDRDWLRLGGLTNSGRWVNAAYVERINPGDLKIIMQ